MSDPLDILCLAARPGGGVLVHNRRVVVKRHGEVLDFERYDNRDELGQAVRTLSGRISRRWKD